MYVRLPVVVRAALAVTLSFAWNFALGETPSSSASGAPPSRTALEALKRLKGTDLDANPALKGAVLRVLQTTRGTADFVELVRDFNLTGQDAGLVEVASKLPETSAGAEAVRLLLARGDSTSLREALNSGVPEQTEGLLRALASAGDEHAIPLLARGLEQSRVNPGTRTALIQGLARTEPGSRELLRLARGNCLDEAGRTTAGLALARSRWPAIREEAGVILPAPRTGDGAALPSIEELIQMRGDPVRGAEVFRGEKAACSQCHAAAGMGVAFGPDLSGIGTKLGRHALYESILDPSAGISFGFEGWSFETRDGEEVFGILASETADEVAVKQQGGVVVRLGKSDILQRHPQSLSIMPSGIAAILTRQELLDLVEFLAGLKTPE